MLSSLLGRRILSSSTSSRLNETQLQMDATLTGLSNELSNPLSLAAMITGGVIFKGTNLLLGRIASPLLAESGLFTRTLAQGLIKGTSLFTEVAAFRTISHRSFNIYQRDEFLNDMITFGTLKGVGRAAQGQSAPITHLLQSGGMVAAHNMGYSLGLTTRPEGTLLQQLVESEVTNVKLGMAMSVVGMAAPGISALERSLELQNQIYETRHSSPSTLSLLPSPFTPLMSAVENQTNPSILVKELRECSGRGGRWISSTKPRWLLHQATLKETFIHHLYESEAWEDLSNSSILEDLSLSFAKRLAYLEITRKSEFPKTTVQQVGQNIAADIKSLYSLKAAATDRSSKWVYALEKVSSAEIRDLFAYASRKATELAFPTQNIKTFVGNAIRSQNPRTLIEQGMQGWKAAYDEANKELKKVPESGDIAKTIAHHTYTASDPVQKAKESVQDWRKAYTKAQTALAKHPDMSDLAREIARFSIAHKSPNQAVDMYIQRWNIAYEEAKALLETVSGAGKIARSIASNAYTSPKPRDRAKLSLSRWKIAYDHARETFGELPSSGNVAGDIALRCIEAKDPKKKSGSFIDHWITAFQTAEAENRKVEGVGPSSRVLANAAYDSSDPVKKVKDCLSQWRKVYQEVLDAKIGIPEMGSIAKSIANQAINSRQSRVNTGDFIKRWQEAYQEACENLTANEDQTRIAKTIADNAFMTSEPRKHVQRLLKNWKSAFELSQSRSIALQAMLALKPITAARQALATRSKSRNGMQYLQEALTETLIGKSIQKVIDTDTEVRAALAEMAQGIHNREDARALIAQLETLYLQKGLGLEDEEVDEYLPPDRFSFIRRGRQ